MEIRYRIVDQTGDEFNLSHFINGGEFPVKIRSCRILSTGEPGVEDTMEITLEFLHSLPKQPWEL